MDKFRDVKVEVLVSLDEIIEADIDEFNRLVCALTGEDFLQDISFRPVSVDPDGGIVIEVIGYVDPEDDWEDFE